MPFAFQQVAASSDAKAFYAALVRWLDRAGAECGPREFAKHLGDEALQRQIDNLTCSLYSDPSVQFDDRQVLRLIKPARDRLLESRDPNTRSRLPPLNLAVAE